MIQYSKQTDERREAGPMECWCLHGAVGMAADWRGFAKTMAAAGISTRAVDLWRFLECEAMSLPAFGQALNADASGEVFRGNGRALLGYSMGGRMALHTLLEDHHPWQAAIIISAHPGLEDETEKSNRRTADTAWATRALAGDWQKFLADWNSQPIFHAATLRDPQASSSLIMRRREIARSFVDWSLGAQQPLWSRIGNINVPVLWIVGENDTKFLALAERAVSLIPNARLAIAPDAGHRVPWDAGRLVLRPGYKFPADWRIAPITTLTDCFSIGVAARCRMLQLHAMWTTVREFEDIRYETTDEGSIAKITINRPEVRNAFRPKTVQELLQAFDLAHEDPKVGVIVLTGAGDLAFCSGGDQKVRGHAGYIGEDGIPRLNVLDLQKKIRSLPKPVVAMVAGYAIGGGHVLHIVCDLTIAADNARFGQTGPKVGSFDGGLGSSYLARIVGQKKAREIWFLCRQYDAQEALNMGLVNTVVPLADLEKETLQWCREMLVHSPLALRCLKSALNADCDGQIGLLDLAGNATLLYYMSEEGREGKQAFIEKRKPDFSKFPRVP